MKLTALVIPENPYIKNIVIGDDGSIAILYKGLFRVVFKTNDEEVNNKPLSIGPSLQIRIR